MRWHLAFLGSLIAFAPGFACSSGGDASATLSTAAPSASVAPNGTNSPSPSGPVAASASAEAAVFNFTPQDKAILIVAGRKYAEALFGGELEVARSLSMDYDDANSLTAVTSGRAAYDKRVDAFYKSVDWITKDRESNGPLEVVSVEVVDVSAMTREQAPALKRDYQKAWIRPVVQRNGKPVALPGELGKFQSDALHFIHTPRGWRHAP